MFKDKSVPPAPAARGPILVHKSSTPDRTRTTYTTRAVFDDLCTSLEKFESQGWQVHTVERRYSGPHGEYHWVLLRKPGESIGKLGGRNA